MRERNGTTRVIFEPVDLLAKLAVLVPKAQSQYGTLSRCIRPEQQTSWAVDACKTGKGSRPKAADGQEEKTPVQRHAAKSLKLNG